jgi:antitoxin YefM
LAARCRNWARGYGTRTTQTVNASNEDHDAIEIVSRHGNAFLVSAEDHAALREGAYLLRSPANGRRLLSAYENALNGIRIAQHALIDPDAEAGRAR